MNLLYFTETFYPHIYGGGEYIFFLFASELVKRGHNVSVITNRFVGSDKFEEIEGIRIYRVGKEKDYSNRLNATILFRLNYVVLSVKKAIELIRECKRNGHDIDIIHSNTYIPTFSGQISSTLFRIPHIITFHDVYSVTNKEFWNEWMKKQQTKSHSYSPLLSNIVEKIVAKLPAKLFHTVSEASKDDLVQFGIPRHKVKVIGNGLKLSDYNINRYPFDPNSNKPTAIFIGRLVFYKNVDILIKAFRVVLDSIPNARLVIVGEGPYLDHLVEVSSDIKRNIEFTGKISHEEKVKKITSSLFMVFPSLYEGFGIAVIEAFACQKPVLVSNVRPLSDIVIDNYTGFILPPDNENEWAKRMVDLFKDPVKQQEMGKNAYNEFLSKYQIEITVSELEGLYELAITKN
jgi:glycosyltransferase involved in cell wall biosynthesis